MTVMLVDDINLALTTLWVKRAYTHTHTAPVSSHGPNGVIIIISSSENANRRSPPRIGPMIFDLGQLSSRLSFCYTSYLRLSIFLLYLVHCGVRFLMLLPMRCRREEYRHINGLIRFSLVLNLPAPIYSHSP